MFYSNKNTIKSYNIKEELIMQNCEFVTFISALACAIAKDKSQDESNILSAIFTQLRRYFGNTFHIEY